jgi:hypothetical protein
VLVTTTSGVVIPGASVTLTRSGFSATEIGSGCGQVFFGPVANEIDYGLEVSAPGYSPVVLSDVVINGVTELIIQL